MLAREGTELPITIKSEMDIDINVKDTNRTHQIGVETENKRQPIIVKFVQSFQ